MDRQDVHGGILREQLRPVYLAAALDLYELREYLSTAGDISRDGFALSLHRCNWQMDEANQGWVHHFERGSVSRRCHYALTVSEEKPFVAFNSPIRRV
jgi:hypothetical protein